MLQKLDLSLSLNHINPEAVLEDYDSVKEHIDILVEKNAIALLGSIVQDLYNFICEWSDDWKQDFNKKELNNLSEFLSSIPIEVAQVFIIIIDSKSRRTEEFKYFFKLGLKLYHHDHSGYIEKVFNVIRDQHLNGGNITRSLN